MMTDLELKQKYDKILAEIESEEIYDGRGKGVDVYACKECENLLYTRYKDKGVKPFIICCRKDSCNGIMFKLVTITEECAEREGFIVHNWVRPTFEQLLQLSECAQKHVLNGGVMLEYELDSEDENMIKEKFGKVQDMRYNLV